MSTWRKQQNTGRRNSYAGMKTDFVGRGHAFAAAIYKMYGEYLENISKPYPEQLLKEARQRFFVKREGEGDGGATRP